MNLSVTQILTAWDRRIISREATRSFLLGLRYSESDADMILGLREPAPRRLCAHTDHIECVFCGSRVNTDTENCRNCGGNQFARVTD